MQSTRDMTWHLLLIIFMQHNLYCNYPSWFPFTVKMANNDTFLSLSYIYSGMQFSTKDKDNDRSGKSCAIKFKGGWWYRHCHNANLNGLYHGGPYKSYADGVCWNAFKGLQYSLKRTELKLQLSFLKKWPFQYCINLLSDLSRQYWTVSNYELAGKIFFLLWLRYFF